jgi:hypothetical protein
MDTQKGHKIQRLLEQHKPGTVCLGTWMETLGISRDLRRQYQKSGWLESLGVGVFKRPTETVQWQGALYSLQEQAGLTIHAGAMTALSLQGLAHYARFGEETVFLFSTLGTKLPAWFRSQNWQAKIRFVKTGMLPVDMGLTTYELANFSIRIAAAERAILECLYLAPDEQDLLECYQVMEGLVNLRPQLVQALLKACASIQVKRLFLYMAEKAGHRWLSYVDTSTLDLGSGNRTVTKGGVYVARHRLLLPKELVAL